MRGEWVSVVSGCWKYSVCIGFGGNQLFVAVPGFGWVIAHGCVDEPKHIVRRLCRKMAKRLRAKGVQS